VKIAVTMKINTLTLSGSLLALFCQAVGAVKVNPLPKPVSISWGETGPLKVSQDLKLESEQQDNKILSDAFERTVKTIKDLKWTPTAVEEPLQPVTRPFKRDTTSELSKVKVNVKDYDADLQLGVDESYSLNITEGSEEILITAETVWGVLHALQTVQQIVISDGDEGMIIEQPVSIEDKPLYPHRGIHLDTARNYYAVDAILRQIDALALSKLNVLHWHFVDAQSWPVELKSFPEMTNSAYSPKDVYSAEDIKKIVSYGKARGVRVYPEIDMPGHSYSGWKDIDPKLLACATSEFSDNINNYQLDALYNKTYDTVEKVYNEVSEMFSDNLFHVGADELVPSCFEYSESIQNFLKEDESRTVDDVLEYWIDKALPIFKKVKDRKIVMWEDVVLSESIKAGNVPKDVIMQSWNNGTDYIQELVKMGHEVIVSSADFFYLDCGFGGYLGNDPRYNVQKNPDWNNPTFNYGGDGGSWCSPYKSWQRIYAYDFAANLTESERKKIIGVEAPLWAEQVDDQVADGKIWPRAAALSELVWSGNKNSTGQLRNREMTQRIANFRDYLVANGIRAAPIMPRYCIQHPHNCDYDVYLG
jgi:hexosaminidase